MSKVSLFNLDFDNLDMKEALDVLDQFIRSRKPHKIFTPNVALTVWAQKDPFLKSVYDDCDLLLEDGMALYYASRLLGTPIKENLAGYLLFLKLLEIGPERGYRFYFLGARQELLEKAVENARQKYKGIQIVGYRNGYYSPSDVPEIVRGITAARPDILFIAISTPLKEKFVSSNLEVMGVPVCLGVGGSFDILAGYCRQAPSWMSTLCLDWFYRLLQEPRRLWKRYLTTNTIFLKLFIQEFWRIRIRKSTRALVDSGQ